MLENHQYYIETVINSASICKVQTKNKISLSVSNTYLKWDKKVIVRENICKYCRKNFDNYKEIIHIACKSVHIRTLLKDKNCKSHCSLTDIIARLNEAHMWITYSDLITYVRKVMQRLIQKLLWCSETEVFLRHFA